MNESFRVCNDSAISNRVLEFSVLLFGLKRVYYICFERQLAVKTTVNIARLYVIDDVMKIKLASKWRPASPSTDLSPNISLNLAIEYYRRSVLVYCMKSFCPLKTLENNFEKFIFVLR